MRASARPTSSRAFAALAVFAAFAVFATGFFCDLAARTQLRLRLPGQAAPHDCVAPGDEVSDLAVRQRAPVSSATHFARAR